MGWLWLVGSIKLQVSFAKEPYKRDDILQKRPMILSILLTVATPYNQNKLFEDDFLDGGNVSILCVCVCVCVCVGGSG